MSDWNATHSVSLEQQLDQEQDSYTKHFTEDALRKYQHKNQRFVNFAVYRIMYQLFDKGVFDEPRADRIKANVRSEEHSKLAFKIAEDSMVLLKN